MYEIWKEEFDSLADEGRMINFVLHPQFMGRASRIQMLSRLIGYMKTHGAWLDTNKAVASWILEQNGFGSDPSKVQETPTVTQKPGIRGPMCLPGRNCYDIQGFLPGRLSGLHLLTGSRAPHSCHDHETGLAGDSGAVSDLHGHTDGYRHGWFHRCRGLPHR